MNLSGQPCSTDPLPHYKVFATTTVVLWLRSMLSFLRRIDGNNHRFPCGVLPSGKATTFLSVPSEHSCIARRLRFVLLSGKATFFLARNSQTSKLAELTCTSLSKMCCSLQAIGNRQVDWKTVTCSSSCDFRGQGGSGHHLYLCSCPSCSFQ